MVEEVEENVVDDLKKHYSGHFITANPGLATEHYYRDCCYYFRGEVAPALPEDKEARILEIGCSVGHLIRFLTTIGYKHVSGVEINRQLYDLAVAYVGEKAEFLECGDAMRFLKSDKGRFDMIIAMDVIEHFTLEQATELCRLAYEALTPGGRLLLRTPNLGNILGSYALHHDLTHQMGYTEISLRQLLVSAGFEHTEVLVPKFGWAHLQTFRLFATNIFHRLLFGMQGQPQCVRFDPNMIMCAHKAKTVP